MEAKLIKIDRNGSKHFEGMVKCDRCGGTGIYAYCVMNGVIVPTIVDNGVCHKCNGSGKVAAKWIERTEEYQAKLDAKRKAKWEAEEANRKAEQERIDAERKAREEEEARKEAERIEQEKARKAISQHVGNIGDKVTLVLIFEHTATFTVTIGWHSQEMGIHTMKDSDGNKFIWKTQNALGIETENGWLNASEGDIVTIKGTIKEHSEYKDEKQTVLTRCKVIAVKSAE